MSDQPDAEVVEPDAVVEAELIAAQPEPPPPPEGVGERLRLRRTKYNAPPRWVTETPQGEKQTLVWELACQLELVGHKELAIAKILGRAPNSVHRWLRTQWALDYKERILPEIRKRMLENTVDASTQFMMAAPRMATVMINAAEEDPSPFRRALVAEKNLALAGVQAPKAVPEGEGDTKRQAIKKLSDADLLALVESDDPGSLPDAVRSALAIDVTPTPDDDAGA